MTTLDDRSAKKKPEPSAEEAAAKELVRHPQEQGLSATGANARPRTARRDILLQQRSDDVLVVRARERDAVIPPSSHPDDARTTFHQD